MPSLKELIDIAMNESNPDLLLFHLNKIKNDYKVHTKRVLESDSIDMYRLINAHFTNMTFEIERGLYKMNTNNHLIKILDSDNKLIASVYSMELLTRLLNHQHGNIANEYRN
jgi:hypothetical protein